MKPCVYCEGLAADVYRGAVLAHEECDGAHYTCSAVCICGIMWYSPGEHSTIPGLGYSRADGLGWKWTPEKGIFEDWPALKNIEIKMEVKF